MDGMLLISSGLVGLIALMTGLFFVARYEGGKSAGKGNQAEVVGGGFGIAIGSVIILYALWKGVISGMAQD